MSDVSLNKALILVLVAALTSCSKTTKSVTEKTAATTFASPSEAGAALLAAARSGDRNALLAIFGPDGGDILLTGDAAQDTSNLRAFAEAYTRMNRWGKLKAGGQILYVGADNIAFPVPLGQNSAGRWYFDTAAGKDEILARRIGKGELTAIAALESIANAQRQFVSQTSASGNGAFAQKFVSDPGAKNGLYWPAAEGQPISPLGRYGDFAKAVAAAGDRPPLFNGYYYRVIAKPRDFAILAYPAEYRNTGIMTFVVRKDGKVYQKDLGEKTGDIAAALTEVTFSDGWSPVTPQTGSAARTQ